MDIFNTILWNNPKSYHDLCAGILLNFFRVREDRREARQRRVKRNSVGRKLLFTSGVSSINRSKCLTVLLSPCEKAVCFFLGMLEIWNMAYPRTSKTVTKKPKNNFTAHFGKAMDFLT